MRQILIFLTVIFFIVPGCEKEITTDPILTASPSLICNAGKINRDSVVYKPFDPPLTPQTRMEFNPFDSLFHDTLPLDINADGEPDFLFFYEEVYSKGPFFQCSDSLYKYLQHQYLHVRTGDTLYISSDYSGVQLLFPDDMIDSVQSIQHKFVWHSEPFEEHLFRFSAGTLEPQQIEYYLPFMYLQQHKQRYGWIRLRLSMIENLNTVYYSTNHAYHETIVKTEIVAYAYQKF